MGKHVWVSWAALPRKLPTGSEPSTPQATVPSTSSCWQEPWTRCPGPDCSQDIPGMVPLLRSWPSVQSPGHHPRPHPARRLSGRTPLCLRSPRWFPGRVPWQGRPGLRGPCPGGLRPVSLQFGDLVTCRLRGPCLQGLVTCWPPCRGDQTCQRRVSLAGPEGTAGPGCDGSVRSACNNIINSNTHRMSVREHLERSPRKHAQPEVTALP